MTHNAAAKAAVLALGMFVLGAGAATERSAHAESRSPCTSAEVDVDVNARKVTVSFRNRCEVHIGCKVQWSLRCGKGSNVAKEEMIRVDGKGDASVIANAISCGDGDWRISPPRWRCDEPEEAQVVERSSETKKKRR